MRADRPCLTTVADVLHWLQARGIQALTVDSRAVPRLAASAPVAFVAWPGAATDGRAYVPQALAAGAQAALLEAEGLAHCLPMLDMADDRWVPVLGLKALLAELAHAFYGEPSAQLEVVAVTGTNGKTSTSWWTAQALTACGMPAGVVGTLGVGRPEYAGWQPTGLTTPDPVTLHAIFRQFLSQGLKAAAIEASSIGIEEHRLDATRVAVAQFTNFTQDHLDYHGDMATYWRAKAKLFMWPGLRAAVVNVDDAQGDALSDLCEQQGLSVWRYALHRPARLYAARVETTAQGMRVHLQERDSTLQTVLEAAVLDLPLMGEFNASNVLCVIGALRALAVPLADAVRACAGLTAVPGRMQQVQLDGAAAEPTMALPLVVVDYAHTPDALQKALLALRPVVQARDGRLWCVFGCGGDRDATKRPLMGAMADQYADDIVLTSDNPRHERPGHILSQILMGIARTAHVAVIENRQEAIAHAVMHCAPHDVVLLAGKGHETTQEIAGHKHPFSDVQVSMQALQIRRAA
jgi:UDP-N-acetylmuramyl-tripeptide synthetase